MENSILLAGKSTKRIAKLFENLILIPVTGLSNEDRIFCTNLIVQNECHSYKDLATPLVEKLLSDVPNSYLRNQKQFVFDNLKSPMFATFSESTIQKLLVSNNRVTLSTIKSIGSPRLLKIFLSIQKNKM